jgi:subfamily B ATP-binding cassette protein MsbA
MIPLASLAAKTLGKRMGKIVTQQMDKASILTSYLIEIFKNHKLMKIFQKENYEKTRANQMLSELKDKTQKINVVYVRASPIMEFLTGIMIAFLIFISAKLVSKNELEVSNFFSFLAAMMLAYQPVRSLATLNITIQQGLSGARRVLPIVENEPTIKDLSSAKNINIKVGQIIFKNVSFNYSKKESQILKNVNLNFEGKK